MIEEALEGDPNALRICIERLLPKAKHKSIESDISVLEKITTTTLLIYFTGNTVSNILPDEGKKVIQLLEEHESRRSLNF